MVFVNKPSRALAAPLCAAAQTASIKGWRSAAAIVIFSIFPSSPNAMYRTTGRGRGFGVFIRHAPAVLLRESYRDGGKVKTRTLANLIHWPDAKVEALCRVLKGGTAIVSQGEVLIERSLPHGHVAAVLGMARKLGLHKLLPRAPSRLAKLALAMIVARVRAW